MPIISVFSAYSTVVAVRAGDDQNALLDAQSGQVILEWDGPEARGVCQHESDIFIFDYPGRFFRIRDRSVENIYSSSRQNVYTSCLSLSAENILLAGRGGCYAVFSVNEHAEHQKTLAEDGIVEPDRNVVRLKRVGKRALAFGLQQLLLEFQGTAFRSLITEASTGETALYDAAEIDGVLVLTGIQARSPVFGVFDPAARTVSYERVDLEPGYFPEFFRSMANYCCMPSTESSGVCLEDGEFMGSSGWTGSQRYFEIAPDG